MSSIGLPLLEQQLKSLDEENREVKEIGIVFTMVDWTSNILYEIEPQIKSEQRYIFGNKLSSSVQVARAVSANQPLFYFPKSAGRGGEEIKAITNEFIQRVGAIWA